MEQGNRIGQLRGAALLIVVGITAGAFGAHALKDALDADRLEAFGTASRYATMMGAAILAAVATGRSDGMPLVQTGTWLFSGSIFTLVLGGSAGWNWVGWLGPVTPLGGALMIVGWLWWLVKLSAKGAN